MGERRSNRERRMEGVIAKQLQGCNSMRKLKRIQAQVLVQGLREDPLISSMLLYFCAVSRAGDLSHAHLLFFHHVAPPPTTAHFNSLIRAHSPSHLSISLYNSMLADTPSRPDEHTFAFLLKSLHHHHAKCRETHAAIVRAGFSSHAVVSTALSRCYADLHLLREAAMVFSELPLAHRDLLSCNSILSSFSRAGMHHQALRLYRNNHCFALDTFTLVALLSSCANAGDLRLGVRLHAVALVSFSSGSIFVANALVDMYAKCGRLDSARKLFDDMPERDLCSWNSLIVGLGVNGRGSEAIDLLRRMLLERRACLWPNAVTFLGVLQGCSYQGLVEEGLYWFREMVESFGVQPDGKHWCCVVDLLSRAGEIERALEMIRRSTWCNDPALWRSLLSSCKIHGNVELGEFAARKLVDLGVNHGGDRSLIAGIYSRDGEDVGEVGTANEHCRRGMNKSTPGWSWTQ